MDFPTVLFNGNDTVLADIHAVSDGYPLRGQVRVSAQPFGPAQVVHGIPATRHACGWKRACSPRWHSRWATLSRSANFKARIAAVIAYLPDGGFGFSSLAPKVLLNDADLPATGLVNANSRVRYKLLMAGTPEVITGLEKKLERQLPAGVEMQDVRDSRRELVDATDSSQRFLALAALVSVLISAVAVILAARRYATHYTDTAAVLKCLGLTRRRVQTLLLLELLWLGILAGLVGVLIGFLAQYGLVAALKGCCRLICPPPPSSRRCPPSVSAWCCCSVSRCRRSCGSVTRHRRACCAVIWCRRRCAVMWSMPRRYSPPWHSPGGRCANSRLALYVLLGLVITVAVLTLGAVLLLVALRRLRHGAGIGWRYGLANLNRHQRDAVIQMVAFGIGLMVLLLLGLVRGDLLSSWRTSLPEDAPNEFIINIQPDQRSHGAGFLHSSRICLRRTFIPSCAHGSPPSTART